MEPPSARMGASLSGSEDGRRLWLFGGNTGAGSVNDLYCLELETRTWSQVSPLSSLPFICILCLVHLPVAPCCLLHWQLSTALQLSLLS